MYIWPASRRGRSGALNGVGGAHTYWCFALFLGGSTKGWHPAHVLQYLLCTTSYPNIFFSPKKRQRTNSISLTANWQYSAQSDTFIYHRSYLAYKPWRRTSICIYMTSTTPRNRSYISTPQYPSSPRAYHQDPNSVAQTRVRKASIVSHRRAPPPDVRLLPARRTIDFISTPCPPR